MAGRPKKGCSKFFGVCLPDSNRRKHPCLVAATGMLRVEAVFPQFARIYNGALAIGQLHETPIVTTATGHYVGGFVNVTEPTDPVAAAQALAAKIP